MIEKYIDELEENSKLSELWCKSQQENRKLKEVIEPNADKQIDGKKIFVCSKCARVKTVLTPWNKIEQGGYY